MSVWNRDNELICKPLETYNDILSFLQNLPTWSSLCKELNPHSKQLIKNIDLISNVNAVLLRDGPEPFCHYDPDAEDVERHDPEGLPKTLVCHDMANGYHDDAMIDGTGNYDAYTFYNWAGIDIFCYFSHHLITIPPVGWINVGHDHGVKVIGTVISEWAEGVAFWDQVLRSDVDYKTFASALVAIAKTLKFDGWLLNIENKIAKPQLLLEFVQHLHAMLHQELTDAVLIWYDSVTIEGHLNWQNALNHKNKAFFDACDGLFTNYSWTEENVVSSAELAAAEGRLADLYIGIDVWGRNFYGGGQFNVQEAIEVAYRQGCSLAVFAPAWTHEALTLDPRDLNTTIMATGLDKYAHFLLRERALWDSVWKFLNTRVPTTLPFKTSFCRGQGKKRRLYGEVMSPMPWFNLRHMQYQPNSSHGPHGYFLSSIDNIIIISRRNLLKETKGIIKRKENIGPPILEPTCDSLNDTPSESGAAVAGEETRVPDDGTPAGALATGEDGTRTWKQKIRYIIKQLFKYKSPRSHSDSDEQNNTILTEHKRTQTHEQRRDAEKEEKRKTAVEFKEQTELVPVDDVEVEGEAVEEEEEGSEAEAGLSRLQLLERLQSRSSTARSLMQMSVNIKLGVGSTEKTRYGLAYVADELPCLEVYFHDSFVGGSCLKINPFDHNIIKLFHCDFECEDSLIVCVVTKTLPGFEHQHLNIKFYMTNAKKERVRVNLIGRCLPSQTPPNQSALVQSIYPINNTMSAEFKKLQAYLLLELPGFYVPVENTYGWIVRYYEVRLPGSRVTSINCSTGEEELPILLGHVGLCPRQRPAVPGTTRP